MSDAPIWSTKVMANTSLNNVPLQLLTQSDLEIWDMKHFMGVDAQYYHGKGLDETTKPGGLMYTNASAGKNEIDRVVEFVSCQPIFTVGALAFVAKTVCDALSRFDLGDGRLTRVPIFQPDRKTRLGPDFFLLEFSNTKITVDRDKTDRCRPLYKARPEAGYLLPSTLRGRDVFVFRSALDGPDFWFDPMIRHVQFVSDRVARSLISLGLQDEFKLNKCKFSET